MRQLGDHLNEGVERGITGTGGHRRQHGEHHQNQHQDNTGGAERGGDRNQALDKADRAQTLGKNARCNQQDHHASEGIRHTAIRNFQTREDFLRVKTAHKLQHGGQQHTDDQNGDDVQLWTPFSVKNQHSDDRGERQNGIERGSGRGDFTHVHHFMADVFFLIEIALPEEMRDPHAHDGNN